MKTIFRKCIFIPLYAISIMLFVFSCDDEDEPEIQYPETGFYGDNILMKGRTEYPSVRSSFQAKLPEGKKLKVVLTGNPTLPYAIWGSSSGNNWAILNFDVPTHTQVFQSIDGGHTCELSIHFTVGTYQIDYYENDATSPTYSKTISVK